MSVDRRLQVLEMAEDGPRLILVAGDRRDADHATDPLPHPLRKLVDEMAIVAHAAM
jgi:hypothetical protein